MTKTSKLRRLRAPRGSATSNQVPVTTEIELPALHLKLEPQDYGCLAVFAAEHKLSVTDAAIQFVKTAAWRGDSLTEWANCESA